MVYRDFTLAEKIVISFCCVQLGRYGTVPAAPSPCSTSGDSPRGTSVGRGDEDLRLAP